MNRLDLLLIASLDGNPTIDNDELNVFSDYTGLDGTEIVELCQIWIINKKDPEVSGFVRLAMVNYLLVCLWSYVDTVCAELIGVDISFNAGNIDDYIKDMTTEIKNIIR